MYGVIDRMIAAPRPRALVAQLVERKAFNLVVMGSSPIQGAEILSTDIGDDWHFYAYPPSLQT
jgi:hypothetical protein